jgi:hypothetical protein
MKPFNCMTRMIVFIAFGSLSLLATPSTQIWIPSTDIQGFGVVHLGWDSYIKTDSNEAYAGTGFGYEPTVTNGGITVGVLPFKKIGLEIGIDYRDISANHQYPMYFNAKLGTPEEAFFKYMPAIAVGIFDVGTKKDVTDYNVIYGAIAKTIWKLGRITVGGYTGNNKLLLDMSKLDLNNNGTKDNSGVLVSWDRTIPEITDKLWLSVDYMGAKNSYGALSFGASYAITPDASFIIGYDIYNDTKSYRPTATVQVDMNISVFAKLMKTDEKK